MSDETEKDAFVNGAAIGAVAAALLFGTLALLLGINLNDGVWERNAVKLGHAEYVADESGRSKFQWKIIKVEAEKK